MKIAVVGLGNAGANLHLPACAQLQGVQVVGGVDPDPNRRDEASRRYGIATFESFDAMLESSAPDVVIVCTPPESHAEYCLGALAAGANVICEKPFAVSAHEADRILDAARSAGRQIALNHEFREMPIFRALREQVGAAGVGDLVAAQLWQLMDLPPWKEAGWRSAMPRRSLFEAGIHLLDFAMALFGEKPEAVTATTSSSDASDLDSDALTSVTMEFSRGRLAHVWQNRLCKGETQYFDIRADCREASLRASFGGRARLSAGLHRSTTPHVRLEYGVSGMAWLERGHRRRTLARNPKDPAMVATRMLLERTLDAFARGNVPPASGQDGRDVLQVIAGCYESANAGRRVELGGATAAALDAVCLWEAAAPAPSGKALPDR
jgi:predicted dehydrogenase